MAPPAHPPCHTGLSPAVVWPSSHFWDQGWVRGEESSPRGRSHNPQYATPARLARTEFRQRPVSLATTPGVVLSPPATEMFQFAGFPRAGRTCACRSTRATGCPIRRRWDHRVGATPPPYRGCRASFIGWSCRGILRPRIMSCLVSGFLGSRTKQPADSVAHHASIPRGITPRFDMIARISR